MAHTMHTSGATATRAHKCCCSRSTPQHHHHHHRQTRCRSSPQDIVQLAPHITTLADVHLASALHLLDLQAGASAAVAAASAPADVPAAVSTSAYTPGPVEVGWQIWFAAIVSTVPFVIGAYEFGKRIVSVQNPAAYGLHVGWCFDFYADLAMCLPFQLLMLHVCPGAAAVNSEALQGVWRQWPGAARQVPAQVPR